MNLNIPVHKIVLASLFCFASSAYAGASPFPAPLRVGLSTGALRTGGFALTADSGPLISDNITLGGELYGLRLISIRGLIWEKPETLSGFVGGAKILMGLGNPVAVEPAGEFGWNYRFHSKVDIGLAADFVIGEYIGGALKITVGYLLK